MRVAHHGALARGVAAADLGVPLPDGGPEGWGTRGTRQEHWRGTGGRKRGIATLTKKKKTLK